MQRKVLYHPSYADRIARAALHHARELVRREVQQMREDLMIEAQAIREEMAAGRRELRRLQQLDAAQRSERGDAPLH